MIDELYAACHKELVGWCGSMTGDIRLAEDLVQEAFLRALIHEELLNNLNFHQRRAWMYRTVKNLYFDRRRHAAYEMPAAELPEEGKTASEYVQVDDAQLLAGLSEEERILFVLHYLMGYSSAELGKLYDLPSGTVRSRLASARKHLRQALEEGFGGRRKKRGAD